MIKNALFGYFWGRLLKSHVVFEINTLKSVKLLNFAKKKKKIKKAKYGKKSALFGYCWGQNFGKRLSYWKSAPSNLGNCKSLRKKCLNLWWRMAYLCARILKNYCHIWNNHPQIVKFQNCLKKKYLNLGTKMPYLVIFGPEA